MFSPADLKAAMGVSIKNIQYFQVALSHRSYAKEQGQPDNNEKLEFLGDAILDFVLSDLLMQYYPEDNEGNLSRKRASIVNEEQLAELATEMGLANLVLLGKSERRNGLQTNSRILSSVLEALVGALYRDSGIEPTYAWVEKVFAKVLRKDFGVHDFERDYKTRFQEEIQERFKETPTYRVISHDGPDHQKIYQMEVVVKGEVWAAGEGTSKKAAAQSAAQKAMEKLKT